MEIKMPVHKREFYVSDGGRKPMGCFLGGGEGSSGLGLNDSQADTVTTAPKALAKTTARNSLINSFISCLTSMFTGDKQP